MALLHRPATHSASKEEISTRCELRTIALVGPPNAGKSTLFNSLTNARRTVGNWPGTTVEVGRGVGTFRPGDGSRMTVLDLPGAYGLDPQSPDEAFTAQLLTDTDRVRPDVVVVIVDATRIAQGLYFVSQVRDLGVPAVVALTMIDVAKRRGVVIDVDKLTADIEIPVIALDPRRVRGVSALGEAIVTELETAAVDVRGSAFDASVEATDRRFLWVESILHDAVTYDHAPLTWTDRVDAVATSRVFGPLAFLVVMWSVFQATTRLAAPLQDGLSNFFTGPVASVVTSALERVGLGDSWLLGLVNDGVIAGVGMLVSFLPLMAIMFFLLAVLEDSGYLARAAVVTNRMMRAMGLPGKAFLPLIVGFGCNVPAIAATRVLGDARHRLLTALLIPFTSCSARLTVYVLIAATFFPKSAGNVVFAMYVLSIVIIVVVGYALRATLWRTMGTEPLIIELPPYQRPLARIITNITWVRVRGFLSTAGGIILATVVALWFLQSTPMPGKSEFANVDVSDSVFAAASKTVTPVFAPLGFDDWRTTGALVVGFVAKEAVISSWAQTYAIEEPMNPANPGELSAAIRSDIERSSNGNVIPAVWAFLVFLLAYTPCVATLAAQRREIGARWTAFGVAMQLGVAWILAMLVFQIGSRL